MIDGTPLAKRLVAAYVIGGGIAQTSFAGMQDIRLCTSATDLGCAVHWDTYSEAVIDQPVEANIGNVCTNPLSWELNGGLATKEQHQGAVPASGQFHVELSGSLEATGVTFEPWQRRYRRCYKPSARTVYCIYQIKPALFSAEQGGSFGGGNFHGLDYPVFHMDIRENAKLRVQTFLARQD